MSRARDWMLVVPLAGLCLTGCKRDAAPAPTPRVASAPAASLVPPPAPGAPWASTPRATYPSLAAACRAAHALLQRALGVAATRADSTTFENEFVRKKRTGCLLTATGTFKESGQDPAGAVADAFRSAGWIEAYGYAADGPDGSVIGMRSLEALCIIAFRWDGGDDSDPGYVPEDWYHATVSCAVRVPDDAIAE